MTLTRGPIVNSRIAAAMGATSWLAGVVLALVAWIFLAHYVREAAMNVWVNTAGLLLFLAAFCFIMNIMLVQSAKPEPRRYLIEALRQKWIYIWFVTFLVLHLFLTALWWDFTAGSWDTQSTLLVAGAVATSAIAAPVLQLYIGLARVIVQQLRGWSDPLFRSWKEGDFATYELIDLRFGRWEDPNVNALSEHKLRALADLSNQTGMQMIYVGQVTAVVASGCFGAALSLMLSNPQDPPLPASLLASVAILLASVSYALVVLFGPVNVQRGDEYRRHLIERTAAAAAAAAAADAATRSTLAADEDVPDEHWMMRFARWFGQLGKRKPSAGNPANE